LIDAGKNPKCVDVCPMNAITFGDLDDPNSAVSKAAKNAAALHPEYGTKPKVTYIGLP
jgi:Fe-S-cluster-containing dehydrogenase component